METFFPTSAAAAAIFLFLSLFVVLSASNSCKDAKGEFSLDLITLVITLTIFAIPFIVAGLTAQLKSQVQKAEEKKSRDVLQHELKNIEKELNALLKLDITKEEVVKFQSKIVRCPEKIYEYRKVLDGCEEVEKWLSSKDTRKKLAFELTKVTLKKFNKRKFDSQFKKEFIRNMVRQLFWLYESIKVNNPQSLTLQEKLDMISASPDELRMYNFAHECLNRKIPRRLSEEAKAVIRRYDNILLEALNGSQQP